MGTIWVRIWTLKFGQLSSGQATSFRGTGNWGQGQMDPVMYHEEPEPRRVVGTLD
jgi:hypothetical protein